MSVQTQSKADVRERMARMAVCAMQSWQDPALLDRVTRDGAVAVWEHQQSASTRQVPSAEDAEKWMAAADEVGARFVIPGDEEWPDSLAQLSDVTVGDIGGVPAGLWVMGRSLTDTGSDAVAVAGSRTCTSYGEHTALTLSADLAIAGCTVVSGMAFGIDAAAHRGALGVKGTTVAVVASGLDAPYPAANTELSRRIAERGTLVSEFPPGFRPTRFSFLARNRIIAALTLGTVVCEAAYRSSAVNTAAWATALGRPVMAVPGQITNSLSAAPNRMIRDGSATLVTSADEIRDAIEVS